MKLTKIEMETIILFNEEESMAEIYTHNVKLQNRFNKFIEKNPKIMTKKDKNTFILPKKSLRIMPIPPISEDRKEKMRELGNENKINLKNQRTNAHE